MKFTNKNIVLDSDPKLREKCSEVIFPLSSKEREDYEGLLEYVINSIDKELAEKYDLSPAVGIAAPQVGISKRVFAAYVLGDDDEPIINKIFINPKIVSYSVQNIYIEGGEACLSVNDEYNGNVIRHYMVKVKYYDLDGNEFIEEFNDFVSIVIQHELDHLNGVLFYDHINKDNPLFVPPNTTAL